MRGRGPASERSRLRRRRRRPGGMRQKSKLLARCVSGGDRRLDLRATPAFARITGSAASEPCPRGSVRRCRPAPDASQRAAQFPLLTPVLPGLPGTRSPPSGAEFLAVGVGGAEEHDLRPPPPPEAVALRNVSDQASDLEVVEPPLHALAMSAHEPTALRSAAGWGTPSHHRRQPHDELLDRRRVARRPCGVTETEEVAFERVGARLEPVIAWRAAPSHAARAPEQRADDESTGLGWKRLARRPVPAATPNGAAR
jgi:hypothetical protein